MRKVLVILSVLLGISYHSIGQYADSTLVDTSFLHQVTILPTGYVSINMGSGIQAAGFDGTGFQLQPSCPAGVNIGVSFSKPIVSHLGFSLAVGYCVNKVNTQSYCEGYNLANGGGLVTDATNATYNEVTFLAGPFFTIPFHRFSFDCRLMFGTLDWNSPAVSYTSVATNGAQTPEQIPAENFESYIYGVGIGARVSVYKTFAIIANADYVRSFGAYTNAFVIFDTITTGVAYQF